VGTAREPLERLDSRRDDARVDVGNLVKGLDRLVVARADCSSHCLGLDQSATVPAPGLTRQLDVARSVGRANLVGRPRRNDCQAPPRRDSSHDMDRQHRRTRLAWRTDLAGPHRDAQWIDRFDARQALVHRPDGLDPARAERDYELASQAFASQRPVSFKRFFAKTR